MIRKTLAMGGCAWSTSQPSASVDNTDFDMRERSVINFCWTRLRWKSVSGQDGEITSYSWSTST